MASPVAGLCWSARVLQVCYNKGVAVCRLFVLASTGVWICSHPASVDDS
jgi:hypothetical protein